MGSKEEAMKQFGLGDRVRIVRKTDDLPKGSYGTVVRVSVVPDCSDVQFDSDPRRRLVYNGDLERVVGKHAVSQS
jgi:Xrn1 SH3-like domain